MALVYPSGWQKCNFCKQVESGRIRNPLTNRYITIYGLTFGMLYARSIFRCDCEKNYRERLASKTKIDRMEIDSQSD